MVYQDYTEYLYLIYILYNIPVNSDEISTYNWLCHLSFHSGNTQTFLRFWTRRDNEQLANGKMSSLDLSFIVILYYTTIEQFYLYVK